MESSNHFLHIWQNSELPQITMGKRQCKYNNNGNNTKRIAWLININIIYYIIKAGLDAIVALSDFTKL